MKPKRLFVLFAALGVVIAIAGCNAPADDQEPADNQQTQPTENEEMDKSETKVTLEPELSEDSKAIVTDDEVLLEVDDDAIHNWFIVKSQLCTQANTENSPERQEYCEDEEVFKEKTNFKSITVSPIKTVIGFEIESEALSPDSVVGIYLHEQDKVEMLTNYYLGNEFIGFSATGEYFVYKGNCWEAMCGLFVLNSETLNEVLSINNPEAVDLRTEDAEFVRWVSDEKIEYKLGDELMKETI